MPNCYLLLNWHKFKFKSIAVNIFLYIFYFNKIIVQICNCKILIELT